MNDHQKRTSVKMYQLGAYKPVDKGIKFTEPMCYELVGVTYPYRRKEIDLSFFDVFEEENQKTRR